MVPASNLLVDTDLVLHFHVNFMSTTSGETVPESTLQGILAMTLVTTMLFDRFLCYFCSAVQLHTSTVVDSAVLGSDTVVEPFVGRETAVIKVAGTVKVNEIHNFTKS